MAQENSQWSDEQEMEASVPGAFEAIKPVLSLTKEAEWIKAEWTGVAGAEGYELQWWDIATPDVKSIQAMGNILTTNLRFIGIPQLLTQGTIYVMRVRATRNV